MSDLNALERTLGYKFHNAQLLKTALTHKSCKVGEDNERLEFLGDAVLDLIVAQELFALFPAASEGELTKLRSALVSESSFAKIADHLGLGGHLALSTSEARSKGRAKPSILCDGFEAVIGAIYLDGGLKAAAKTALTALHTCFDPFTPERLINDPKSQLQELTQARLGVIPEYRLASAAGPDHKKIFEIELVISDLVMARAKGKSKKLAEQAAAKIALDSLLEAQSE